MLEGVRHRQMRDVEVILVNSGSTDVTEPSPRSTGQRWCTSLRRNYLRAFPEPGLAAATCDLVVIASAHVYPVYPDWLERLLEPFQDPQVALTYGNSAHENSNSPSSRFLPAGTQTNPTGINTPILQQRQCGDAASLGKAPLR